MCGVSVGCEDVMDVGDEFFFGGGVDYVEGFVIGVYDFY